MALYKRRVIYMDDETWIKIRKRALDQNQTISDVIRQSLAPGVVVVPEYVESFVKSDGTRKPGMTQAQRDAVLRGVNRK